MSNTLHEQQRITQTDLNTIFTHFSSQDIEDFYQLYQLWSLQQRRTEVVAHIHELEQQIAENEARLNAISPSPIALATLTLFRAIGVDDIDLLDCMLERGDTWLDHTLQLFLHCERLDMLEGNANQWCIHALEGAYDWIESIADINMQSVTDDTLPFIPATSSTQPLAEIESLPETTEEDFLKKLMSEDGESVEESGSIHTIIAGDATLSQEDLINKFPPAEEIQIEQVEDMTEHVREQIISHEEIEYTAPTTLPEALPEHDQIEAVPEDETPDEELENTYIEYTAPTTLPEALPEHDQIEVVPEDETLDEELENTYIEYTAPTTLPEALPEHDQIEAVPEDETPDEELENTYIEAISPPIAHEDTTIQPEEQIDPLGQAASFPEQVFNVEQIRPSETEQYQRTGHETRKRSKAYSLKQKKEPKNTASIRANALIKEEVEREA